MTSATYGDPRNGTKRIRTVVVSGCVLAALLAIGIMPRILRNRDAQRATDESTVTHPVVSVVHPKLGEATSELLLPGNIEPLYAASIFARTEGYLSKRFVDMGTPVKRGQLLALIASPEVDAQLQQAQATLAQSQAALLQARAALKQQQANAELARLTKERDQPLGQQHAISQQVVDQANQAYDARTADVAAAEANITAAQASVSANEANVRRSEQLQVFERVTAPFDGIVTERNVEQGNLVSVATTSAKPLFSVAQGTVVRIFVDVPQSSSTDISNGQNAEVTVKERVGRVYAGKIVRNANALDVAARTLRTEVQVDNRDGSLLPGMYSEVKFTLPTTHPSLIIPTNSLISDSKGQRVVIVSADHKVHFVPVTLGRDLGVSVEVLRGVSEQDSLVGSPNDLLHEGQEVSLQ